ncbi:MOSC domain-containing protein [Aestuariicoccus sp. MJ-SS9]|uniref:MOSC domain-containing protein n=1 Tax=Aestuariicoccus sp. MJ-SS9 TaxID=3079855 RepID=UPI002909D682|nr:MOSC N-terminal beta barrel domain-containing protein [Aestuariicoccus sp. MJ-SS9]MDU8912234.1 MOSC domain-containing protein [Aestuariicoccus sp. MJ-SS9]
MTARVTEIWRHPVKSHGREPLERVTLTAGEAMPFDRLWAVAHERSTADGSTWVSCANFSRVAKVAALMAITAELDEAAETITLRHPDRPDLTFAPDRDAAAFLNWVRPLMPEDRLQSARIVRAQGPAMTDSDFPSVTLCNMSSHRAVEQRVGRPLSIHRWRGNIWIDGLAPWEEFDWIDRDVRIGGAVLRVRERTDRCASTHSNPDTGRRDTDILSALGSWDHGDFSVRAEVIEGGPIVTGDHVERI